MRRNLTPTVDLSFLDGYLFRFLQEIDTRSDPETSGLEDYYQVRITQRWGGLLEYEEAIARYLFENFLTSRVMHAGIGIGTLACALACNHMSVLGVEGNLARLSIARVIREALIEIWPEVAARYQIVGGMYPSAVAGLPWFGPDVLLLFTNVGGGWTENDLVSIINSMTRFGQVILDLRLFGWVREAEAERVALFERIAATARSAERLPEVASGTHFARFCFA